MSKNPPSLEDDEVSTPIPEAAIKRFKRLRLVFEPSLGVLGFFLVGLCLVFSFFYLDYTNVAQTKRRDFSDQSDRFLWLKELDVGSSGDTNNSNNTKEGNRAEFLDDESGNVCDVFHGRWVWDEAYPLYHSKDCSFLDEGFRCTEFGRLDVFYTVGIKIPH